jgi:acyl dehydratase
VSFQKPVYTPGTVAVRCWMKKIENDGRKIWVEAVVENSEDRSICHAKAEGLWIKIKASSVKI